MSVKPKERRLTSSQQEALDTYAIGLSLTSSVRTAHLNHAQGLLAACDELPPTRLDVDQYLNYLRKKRNYSENSLRTVFKVLRTVFKRNGWVWPYAYGESPTASELDINAIALHPDLIRRMIEAARNNLIPRRHAAYLALSTIYGVRRVEIMSVKRDDIDLDNKTIYIRTAKHGRERMHLVPDEVLPYLDYSFRDKETNFTMLIAWRQIEKAAGIEHCDGVGWHSVRRALNTLLVYENLSEYVIMSFLRWKQRTSSVMPYAYTAGKWSTAEGVQHQVSGDIYSTDTKVFEVHPFLPMWRANDGNGAQEADSTT